jgi:hypothetical protein
MTAAEGGSMGLSEPVPGIGLSAAVFLCAGAAAIAMAVVAGRGLLAVTRSSAALAAGIGVLAILSLGAYAPAYLGAGPQVWAGGSEEYMPLAWFVVWGAAMAEVTGLALFPLVALVARRNEAAGSRRVAVGGLVAAGVATIFLPILAVALGGSLGY